MNLLELQDVLGERIQVCQKDLGKNLSKEEKEKSEMIARLAKQMINNADVILRADKARNDLSRICTVIGTK